MAEKNQLMEFDHEPDPPPLRKKIEFNCRTDRRKSTPIPASYLEKVFSNFYALPVSVGALILEMVLETDPHLVLETDPHLVLWMTVPLLECLGDEGRKRAPLDTFWNEILGQMKERSVKIAVQRTLKRLDEVVKKAHLVFNNELKAFQQFEARPILTLENSGMTQEKFKQSKKDEAKEHGVLDTRVSHAMVRLNSAREVCDIYRHRLLSLKMINNYTVSH